MSIAPFLPGLLAPTPAPAEAGTTTGTASGQATDAQPGAEGEVAFMDALAAALAVQPAVAMAPATPATPATAELGLVTPELGLVTPESGFVTAELGFVTPELGVPAVGTAAAADPRSVPSDAAPDVAPGSAAPGIPTATPVPSASKSELHRPVDLPPARPYFAAPPTPALPAEHPATGAPVRDDVPALQPLATPPEQSVTATDSAVTNPNSGVTNPNSAVTNPKSVERAVVTQVFPEVTRLASSGNGTHRITLTLQPAQLGEVRVTLVVRDGAVRVRMSGEAGDGAVRQALASGAPELQRMLERGGATEARVLVRDLNAAPLLMPTPAARNDFAQAWSGQPDQQSGQQSGQQQAGQSEQSDQSNQGNHFGQSRGDTQPGRSGHPHEQAGRHATTADVVPGSTPTPGRLDRNL